MFRKCNKNPQRNRDPLYVAAYTCMNYQSSTSVLFLTGTNKRNFASVNFNLIKYNHKYLGVRTLQYMFFQFSKQSGNVTQNI